jgi:hypothetical protein
VKTLLSNFTGNSGKRSKIKHVYEWTTPSHYAFIVRSNLAKRVRNKTLERPVRQNTASVMLADCQIICLRCQGRDVASMPLEICILQCTARLRIYGTEVNTLFFSPGATSHRNSTGNYFFRINP